MIRNRLFYSVALIGSVVFFGFYDQWFSTFFLLFLILLPFFSLLCSLPAIFRFRLKLYAPAAVTLGEPAKLTLRATATLPLPRYRLRLRLRHAMTGSNVRLSVRRPAALPTNHCGLLEITARNIRRYDYLGLFCFPVRGNLTVRTLVRPKPVAPDQIPNLQTLSTYHLVPKSGGSYSEIHELRQYRPGDSLRTIHWKASAKTDELMVREPMEPAEIPAVLTVDLRGAPAELDNLLGQLLWLGQYLLDHEVEHQIQALTGNGVLRQTVTSGETLGQAIDTLLASPLADGAGSLQNVHIATGWRFHVTAQNS